MLSAVESRTLVSALWIYFAYYNFVKTHTSLNSPAMAANATDHLWATEELLNVEASS